MNAGDKLAGKHGQCSDVQRANEAVIASHNPWNTSSKRPRATLILLAYNQEEYIEEAVGSALRQDFQDLEIIISDDCSVDRTVERAANMLQAYRGSHRVILLRNQRNLGLIPHFNKIVQMANSEIVICAAGDDISRVDRCHEICQIFAEDPDIYAVHSDVMTIDGAGRELGISRPPSERLNMTVTDIAGSWSVIIGATAAYRMTLFEKFGFIDSPRVYEDLIMSFRAALIGRLRYIPKPLVYYRQGVGISAPRIHSVRSEAKQQAIRVLELRLDTLTQRAKDCRAQASAASIAALRVIRRKVVWYSFRLMLVRQGLYQTAAQTLSGRAFSEIRLRLAGGR